jgi:ferredoxin-NADP reductase
MSPTLDALASVRHRLVIQATAQIGALYRLIDCAKPEAFHHRAGQHVVLRFQDDAGVFERSYSIATAPSEDDVKFCVRLGGDGRATAAWERLGPGCELRASAPQGDFGLNATRRDVMLIAGGSGIAPMRAMLYEALGSGRHVTLIFGAYDAAALPYADDLVAVAAAHPQVNLKLYAEIGQAPGVVVGRVLDAFSGHVPASGEFYICGPVGMAVAVRGALTAAGVPATSIFEEAFG